MKYKSLIIGILFVFAGLISNAQSHNEQVTVEGSYRPQIKRAERLQKSPESPENKFDIPDYKAETKDFNYGYNIDVETMSAMTYKADYVANDKCRFPLGISNYGHACRRPSRILVCRKDGPSSQED